MKTKCCLTFVLVAMLESCLAGGTLVTGIDVVSLVRSYCDFKVELYGANRFGKSLGLLGSNGEVIGMARVGVFKDKDCAVFALKESVRRTSIPPKRDGSRSFGDLTVAWDNSRIDFCRDNVYVSVHFSNKNGEDSRDELLRIISSMDEKLQKGESGVARGEELMLPVVIGLELRQEAHGRYGWAALLDARKDGCTVVVDQCGVQASSDDTACGVCFVTDCCVVSDMMPVQGGELKRKRLLYDKRRKCATDERERSSARVKRTLSKKMCTDLLNAAPDMYKQHKAILRIMNEGDSSCVSALIPFTMPDKDSLLRQDAVKALGTIGAHSAVSRLIEMIQTPVMSRAYDEEEDEAILRREVVLALGRVGDAAALAALDCVASARHEYESVRELARAAIARLSTGKDNGSVGAGL